MLVHIGCDKMIDLQEAVCVFDYQTLKASKQNKEFFNKIKSKAKILGQVENISSCVLSCDKKSGNENIYFSPISCATLLKRFNSCKIF